MAEEKNYPCRFSDCPKVFQTSQARAGHERWKHGMAKQPDIIEHTDKGGVAMNKDELRVVFKELQSEEERAKVDKQRELNEKASLTEAIAGINTRLDKIDADFCSQFPGLCVKVESMEKTMTQPRVDYASEEWKERRRKDVEHILLDDCPECGPMRQDVLIKAGKQIVNLEAKVDEVEEAVEPELPKPELKTSPGHRAGYKWDSEKEVYVEQR